MRASCTICSDLFDDLKPILAAPCGHTFHSSCLNQWIDCSNTCPECRKRVTWGNVLKLYFNISNDEVNNTIFENEIHSLKAELNGKIIEINKCEKEKRELRYYVKKAEEEVETLQQKTYKFESEIADLNLKLKSLSKLQAKVPILEQRNLALTNDLQHLNHVQMIISGTQTDVQDILNGCGNGPEATKQMATYCSLLKRELQQVIDSKHKLKSEILTLKKNIGYNTFEFNKIREENKQIKEQLAHLEKENLTLLNRPLVSSCTTNATKVLISCESPTPERVKKRTSLSEDFKITPISKRPTYNNKISNVVYKKELKPCASYVPVSRLKFADFSTQPKQMEENSVIRSGYNGFGGHSNFIPRSSIVMKNGYKRKISNIKKKP